MCPVATIVDFIRRLTVIPRRSLSTKLYAPGKTALTKLLSHMSIDDCDHCPPRKYHCPAKSSAWRYVGGFLLHDKRCSWNYISTKM